MTTNGTNGHNHNTSIVRPGAANGAGAAIARTGFGTQEIEQRRETQGSALAERAKAETQARYIMALQRPRNFDEVRQRLLNHCERPRFAQVAEYAKPVGGQAIRGPSIRFVETALQEWANVMPDVTVTYDDDEKRVTKVALTDLERNITYSEDVVTPKTVERRSPKGGDEVLSTRTNSQGQTVSLIRATSDDLANKVASDVSKKLRNLGLRILPADLVDEAMEVCATTRQRKDAADPDRARKAMCDAFVEFGVRPVDLVTYLGHPLDAMSPAEIDEMRAVLTAIRDGEAKWADLLAAAQAKRGEVEAAPPAAAAAATKIQEKLAAKKAAKKAAPSAQEQAAIAAAEAKAAREEMPEWAGGNAPNPGEDDE